MILVGEYKKSKFGNGVISGGKFYPKGTYYLKGTYISNHQCYSLLKGQKGWLKCAITARGDTISGVLECDNLDNTGFFFYSNEECGVHNSNVSTVIDGITYCKRYVFIYHHDTFVLCL